MHLSHLVALPLLLAAGFTSMTPVMLAAQPQAVTKRRRRRRRSICSIGSIRRVSLCRRGI